jgi:FAD-dependent urate hydroxylase
MKRALIIGGGIAGPVTAMALQKAGLDPVIYEAYQGPADDVGAFLTLAPNGRYALRAIDVHDLVTAASFPVVRAEVFGPTGRLLGTSDLGGHLGASGPRGITRAALYRVLRDEAIRRGIPLEYGKQLSTATTASTDGRVTASFADGTQADGDLLVGADGLHSTTRTLIDPTAPAPRYAGVRLLLGHTRGAGTATATETFRVMRGHGGLGLFGYLTTPHDEIWWFTHLPAAHADSSRCEAVSTEVWKQRLLEVFPPTTHRPPRSSTPPTAPSPR